MAWQSSSVGSLRLSAPSLYPLLPTSRRLKCQSQQVSSQLPRAVETFLRSRLIMCSRRLWNSHQRRKFLRATASRDILKFRVSEIVFPGVFRRYFPPWTPCYFVRIHARLRRMPSKCLRRSKTSHDSHISHQSKPV